MLYNLRTSELLWGYVFRPNKNLMTCYNTLLEPSVITNGRKLAQLGNHLQGEKLLRVLGAQFLKDPRLSMIKIVLLVMMLFMMMSIMKLGLLCLRLICLRGSNLCGDVFMPNRGRSMYLIV